MLAKPLCNPASKIGVNLAEVLHSTLLDEVGCVLEVASNVADQALALLVVEDLAPEDAGLCEVVVVAGVVPRHVPGDLVRGRLHRGGLLGAGEAVGVVVGGAALVGGHVHGSVALVVADGRAVRAVDGDHLVVGAQAVAVSVGV